jgi:rhodanese-related sulfurtransferase
MTTNQSTHFRAGIAQGLVLAGVLLGTTLVLKLLSPGHISPELSQRLLGLVLGVPVVFYANAAPKALKPLTRMRCDAGAEQAFRRFSGWTLLVGGIAYMVTYAVAPLDQAADLPPDHDALLVFYCSNPWCRKAPTAARRAKSLGYRHVSVMPAGITGWLSSALPTEQGD